MRSHSEIRADLATLNGNAQTTDREQLADLFRGFTRHELDRLTDFVLPWLAEHDRRVKAQALHDAADAIEAAPDWERYEDVSVDEMRSREAVMRLAGTVEWLRDRANDLEADS